MNTPSPNRPASLLSPGLLERVIQVAKNDVEPFAADVDRAGRFPQEAIDALKRERLLSAAVPAELGGFGCSLTELAAMCEILGQYCSSTAMIFAMHQIQVGSIIRHCANSDYLKKYLSDLVEHQYLIASVTSEMGIGGDLRSSLTSVLVDGDRFTLDKTATTISYGAYADDLLVTARRSPEASANDQVLVLVHKVDYTLEQTGGWDTLGMRGTCSPGFQLRSAGHIDQVLPEPFAEIAPQTMVPFSHILWASLWVGMAKGAVTRARAFVRNEARKKPGTVPPSAMRLAEVVSTLQTMQQSVRTSCAEYENLIASPYGKDSLSSISFALQMNNLKVSGSQLVSEIVLQCLSICGIAGYKNDSKFSLGRSLRDSLSASLMIGNDRIYATNAALLLVHKDD